jgi:hypothetical protein
MIDRILPIAVVLSAVVLADCATIVEGTTQNIRVEVVPDTGTCALSRNGEPLGVSSPDARMVKVSKSKDDLTFECAAPGHQSKTETLTSTLSPYTVASFFLLDLGLVDAATGAWQKYPERITVVLQPGPPIGRGPRG